MEHIHAQNSEPWGKCFSTCQLAYTSIYKFTIHAVFRFVNLFLRRRRGSGRKGHLLWGDVPLSVAGQPALTLEDQIVQI